MSPVIHIVPSPMLRKSIFARNVSDFGTGIAKGVLPAGGALTEERISFSLALLANSLFCTENPVRLPVTTHFVFRKHG